ncbi:MAG: hypothetical protein ACLTJB_02890, partial [Holdemania filiformis]
MFLEKIASRCGVNVAPILEDRKRKILKMRMEKKMISEMISDQKLERSLVETEGRQRIPAGQRAE